MSKFRKKPVVIEAEQFFVNKKVYGGPVAFAVNYGWPKTENDTSATSLDGKYWVRTLEGPLVVSDGDWVIRGVKDEFYPCKPDIFEATYERVED